MLFRVEGLGCRTYGFGLAFGDYRVQCLGLWVKRLIPGKMLSGSFRSVFVVLGLRDLPLNVGQVHVQGLLL